MKEDCMTCSIKLCKFKMEGEWCMEYEPTDTINICNVENMY